MHSRLAEMPLALLKSPCGPPQGVQRPAHPGHTLRDKQRCKRGSSKCRPPTDAVAPARSSEDRISRNSSSYFVRLLTTRKPSASIIGLDLALHIAGPRPSRTPVVGAIPRPAAERSWPRLCKGCPETRLGDDSWRSGDGMRPPATPECDIKQQRPADERFYVPVLMGLWRARYGALANPLQNRVVTSSQIFVYSVGPHHASSVRALSTELPSPQPPPAPPASHGASRSSSCAVLWLAAIERAEPRHTSRPRIHASDRP